MAACARLLCSCTNRCAACCAAPQGQPGLPHALQRLHGAPAAARLPLAGAALLALHFGCHLQLPSWRRPALPLARGRCALSSVLNPVTHPPTLPHPPRLPPCRPAPCCPACCSPLLRTSPCSARCAPARRARSTGAASCSGCTTFSTSASSTGGPPPPWSSSSALVGVRAGAGGLVQRGLLAAGWVVIRFWQQGCSCCSEADGWLRACAALLSAVDGSHITTAQASGRRVQQRGVRLKAGAHAACAGVPH